jgi:hypothetical protein
LRREFTELQAFKDQLLAKRMDIDTEKQRFATAARELQLASENLKKEADAVGSRTVNTQNYRQSHPICLFQLDYREEALQAREQALQEGLLAMQSNAKALQHRESQLLDGVRLMEAQQSALERIDSDMLDKKLAISAAQRQSLSRQAQQSREKAMQMRPGAPRSFDRVSQSLPNAPGVGGGPIFPQQLPKTPPYHAGNYYPTADDRDHVSQLNMSQRSFGSAAPHFNLDQDATTPTSKLSPPTSWTEQFYSRLQATGGSQLLARQASLRDPAVSELLAAQSTLRATRASLQEASERQFHRKKFLEKEEKFLSAIEKQRLERDYSSYDD